MTWARRDRAMRALAVGVLTGLAACSSGGGGGTSPPPPSANRAPTFSSAPISVTVSENTTETLGRVTASDPDNDALTLSMTGEDAAAFRIDAASGEVRFASPPDFEAPTDTGADNVYTAAVRASDPGGLSATLAVQVRVTNVVEPTDPVRCRDRVFA